MPGGFYLGRNAKSSTGTKAFIKSTLKTRLDSGEPQTFNATESTPAPEANTRRPTRVIGDVTESVKTKKAAKKIRPVASSPIQICPNANALPKTTIKNASGVSQ